MGKIDKKKLIEMFLKVNVGAGVVQIAENFPEEPEIDFDALYTEFFRTAEANCFAFSPFGFRDFLKSKHISAPKPKQKAKKPLRKCKVGKDGRPAYFHGWFQFGNTTDGCEGMAIVEFEDGSTDYFSPGYITFEKEDGNGND